MPRSALESLIRAMAEVVLGAQLDAEETPGAVRRELARQALIAAVRS